MAELIIGFGKGKPPAKSKDAPMGGSADDDDEKAPESAEVDSFDSALDDAYTAVENKDRDAFKEALSAAISAKCAEMYEEK